MPTHDGTVTMDAAESEELAERLERDMMEQCLNRIGGVRDKTAQQNGATMISRCGLKANTAGIVKKQNL